MTFSLSLFSLCVSPPICDFDAFNEGKTRSYFESQQAVIALCTYLQGVHRNMDELSESHLLEQFLKLLQVNTWLQHTCLVSCFSKVTKINKKVDELVTHLMQTFPFLPRFLCGETSVTCPSLLVRITPRKPIQSTLSLTSDLSSLWMTPTWCGRP